MKRLRIYLLGMREFRTDFTTHFDYPEIETYDRGRDMAHRLTFRRWDDNSDYTDEELKELWEGGRLEVWKERDKKEKW